MSRRTAFTVAGVCCIAGFGLAQSSIDPEAHYSWAENIGWLNWSGATEDSAVVYQSYMSGYVWSENVGWINLGSGQPENSVSYANAGSSDYGVNIAVTGELSGYAWAENVGWINFDTAGLESDRAYYDACTQAFSGYAWGENIGWVALNGVRSASMAGPACDADDTLENSNNNTSDNGNSSNSDDSSDNGNSNGTFDDDTSQPPVNSDNEIEDPTSTTCGSGASTAMILLPLLFLPFRITHRRL